MKYVHWNRKIKWSIEVLFMERCLRFFMRGSSAKVFFFTYFAEVIKKFSSFVGSTIYLNGVNVNTLQVCCDLELTTSIIMAAASCAWALYQWNFHIGFWVQVVGCKHTLWFYDAILDTIWCHLPARVSCYICGTMCMHEASQHFQAAIKKSSKSDDGDYFQPVHSDTAITTREFNITSIWVTSQDKAIPQ